MRIVDCEQNTPAWFAARVGIPTASEFGNLLTPEFKFRTGETPRTYLFHKLAEAWTHQPLHSWTGNKDTENGSILEDEAKPFYELETGEEITSVGFVTTDDGRVGCSPDGLLGDASGIEIKCPRIETHLRYLMDGELPKDYAAQVHGAMYVTGRPSWRFMSYHRGFPPLILTVGRDEKIQSIIKESLDAFIEKLADAIVVLTTINGGSSRPII